MLREDAGLERGELGVDLGLAEDGRAEEVVLAFLLAVVSCLREEEEGKANLFVCEDVERGVHDLVDRKAKAKG